MQIELRLNAKTGDDILCLYSTEDYQFHRDEGHEMFWSLYVRTHDSFEHLADYTNRDHAEYMVSLLTMEPATGPYTFIGDDLECLLKTQAQKGG